MASESPKVSIILPIYNVEQYLTSMLDNILAFDFQDYEVILVDDGSKDSSGRIIDEYGLKDKRFIPIHQKNAGVSEARNAGIRVARGEYIAFYDPDDAVPHDSLGKLYRKGHSINADMVIGVAVEKSLGRKIIYQNSQKLAKQHMIDPADQHFFKTWAIWHKLFRREFLIENDLKFENYNNAEDGVFTYCCLNHADVITGCDTIAYEYYKRPFWETASATQIISNKYLDGLLGSHSRILEEALKIADTPCYLEPLYIRFIENELINGYYRGIWRAESDMIPRLSEITDKYKRHISNNEWNNLLHRHQDLQLENGFRTIEELNENPLVSFVVMSGLSDEELLLLLGSIYNQAVNRFEVLIDKSYQELPEQYKSKINLRRVSQNQAMEMGRGEYMVFVDSPVMYTQESILQMLKIFEKNTDLVMVSSLLIHFQNKQYSVIPCINAGYGFLKFQNKYNNSCDYDILYSNKMFKKMRLKELLHQKGIDIIADKNRIIRDCFHSNKFSKQRRRPIVTSFSEEQICKLAGLAKINSRIMFRNSQNILLEKFQERLKRHLTREDLERLIKL